MRDREKNGIRASKVITGIIPVVRIHRLRFFCGELFEIFVEDTCLPADVGSQTSIGTLKKNSLVSIHCFVDSAAY